MQPVIFPKNCTNFPFTLFLLWASLWQHWETWTSESTVQWWRGFTRANRRQLQSNTMGSGHMMSGSVTAAPSWTKIQQVCLYVKKKVPFKENLEGQEEQDILYPAKFNLYIHAINLKAMSIEQIRSPALGSRTYLVEWPHNQLIPFCSEQWHTSHKSWHILWMPLCR